MMIDVSNVMKNEEIKINLLAELQNGDVEKKPESYVILPIVDSHTGAIYWYILEQKCHDIALIWDIARQLTELQQKNRASFFHGNDLTNTEREELGLLIENDVELLGELLHRNSISCIEAIPNPGSPFIGLDIPMI